MSFLLKSAVVVVAIILLSLASVTHAFTPQPSPPNPRTHIHSLHGLDAQLMKAVCDGDEVIARALVKEGARIKALGGEAIIAASETRALYPDRKDHALSLLSWLIAAGLDVNYSSDAGYTPLMWAAFTGSADAARILIKHGAKLNCHDKHGNTALMIAARVPGWEDGDVCFPKVAAALVASGAHLNETNTNGDTALLIVSSMAALDIAGYPEQRDESADDLADSQAYAACLIKAGANVSVANKYGNTALLAACNSSRTCKPALAALLLEHGANPNRTNRDAETPLMLVAQVDHYPTSDLAAVDKDAVELAGSLLWHGASINVRGQAGHTCLMLACKSDGVSGPFCKRGLAKLLLAHGANVNAIDDKGNTALMYLAGVTNDDPVNSADVAIARDLLDHGANPAVTNRSGQTALDIARMNNLKRLATLLGGKP